MDIIETINFINMAIVGIKGNQSPYSITYYFIKALKDPAYSYQLAGNQMQTINQKLNYLQVIFMDS